MLFFINQYPDLASLDQERPASLLVRGLTPLAGFFRRCYGFADADFDGWHVGIFALARKHRRHQRMNLWMFHSGPQRSGALGGVQLKLVSLSGLAGRPPGPRRRLEIVRLRGITDEERRRIGAYASAQVGSMFDDPITRSAKLTLILGLPNFLHEPGTFACQSLVVSAYAAAGIYFPHPYRCFPWYNVGRWLGHPLGHPKDRVDPRYPYLMDHHIYRDPRFEVKAAVSYNAETDQLELQTANIKKYSWRPSFRKTYGVED